VRAERPGQVLAGDRGKLPGLDRAGDVRAFEQCGDDIGDVEV